MGWSPDTAVNISMSDLATTKPACDGMANSVWMLVSPMHLYEWVKADICKSILRGHKENCYINAVIDHLTFDLKRCFSLSEQYKYTHTNLHKHIHFYREVPEQRGCQGFSAPGSSLGFDALPKDTWVSSSRTGTSPSTRPHILFGPIGTFTPKFLSQFPTSWATSPNLRDFIYVTN